MSLLILCFAGYWYVSVYQGDLRERNLRALTEISCEGTLCETGSYFNDLNAPLADYVVDIGDLFFLDFANYTGFWFNHADPSFAQQFREPKTYTSRIKETWRMFSLDREVNRREFVVVVAWPEEASWLLVEMPASTAIDAALRQEASKIFSQVEAQYGTTDLRVETTAYAYQVIDAQTGDVLSMFGGLPSFWLQKKESKFFRSESGDLFLVRSDRNKQLQAVSLYHIGNTWQMLYWVIGLFIAVFLITYVIAITFLRRWLLFFKKKPPSLSEALHSGEGQMIEFKRGIVNQELLRSIAAFANTNDGAIFLGVADNGHIAGLTITSLKDQDRLKHQIYELVRVHVRPIANIDVDFEKIRDYIVARVFVPRGYDMLYASDGVIYQRYGDADISATPEFIRRISFEFR